jgi:ABC-type cobalt transport system substrate-binding protein
MITTDRSNGAARAWRVGMWGLFGMLLLTPLIAMQFTDDVRWTGSDFATAAVLFAALGVSIELAMRAITRPPARVGVIVMLVAALLAIWAHGAVGIF